MARKWAIFALGLALIVALGFAVTHVQPRNIAGAPNGFSPPCEPASSVLNPVHEPSAICALDAALPSGVAALPTNFAQASWVDAASRTLPAPAPRTFPPLLHRPPPANS